MSTQYVKNPVVPIPLLKEENPFDTVQVSPPVQKELSAGETIGISICLLVGIFFFMLFLRQILTVRLRERK